MAATRRVLKNYQSLRRHALNARPTIRHTHGSDSFQQRWMRSTSLLSNVSFSSTCDNHTSDNSPLKQRSLATFPLGNQYLQGQLSTPYRSQLTSTTRQISSVTEMLPEFAKQYSIWGGSGYILTALHDQNLPYWACISLTNVFVRSSLVPLVVKGAKTSAQLANVAPEVQFLVSSYTRDAKKLKDANAPPSQRLELLVAMWQSLRGIYKLHGVNPLDVLKSPLMQIPVFWYFSVDIRKLINGGDPELAQQLTESGILWVTDLTEPDPWYGLPILSGMFLYLNVEVAVGRQSLSGETASKSNIARYMKDGFQSLAVLMPCLMAQSPAGVQVYLLTSFIFTLFQGAALRNDSFRGLVGLPLRGAPLPEGKFVNEFILYNKLERETKGVLSPKFQSSFKPYAEIMSPHEMKSMEEKAKEEKTNIRSIDGSGVFAPEYQPAFQPSSTFLIVNQIADSIKMEDNKKIQEKLKRNRIPKEEIAEIAPTMNEVMEAANRGEKPSAPIQIATEHRSSGKSEEPAILNTKKLASRKKNRVKKSRRR